MRIIDADALLESVDKERRYLIARGQTGAEHILVHNFRDLIDNAPTVDITFKEVVAYECGQKSVERPQDKCNCSYCDYFKFSQSFIENVVKFMTDYNIETVEDLMKELNHINELLGGVK